MGKIVDVKSRYEREIREINEILEHIKIGRYYEKSGASGDGYLSNNITKVQDKLKDLINKIECDENSIDEDIYKAFEEHNIK